MLYSNVDVTLPPYENPPNWIPPNMRKSNPLYDNDINQFMPRLIYIKKDSFDEPLGFNIRGGTQQQPYIFVSKVYPNTIAHRCGIRESDQLISVNGSDFRIIDHFDAVKLLKEATEFLIVAKYSPYEYKKSIIDYCDI